MTFSRLSLTFFLILDIRGFPWILSLVANVIEVSTRDLYQFKLIKSLTDLNSLKLRKKIYGKNFAIYGVLGLIK